MNHTFTLRIACVLQFKWSTMYILFFLTDYFFIFTVTHLLHFGSRGRGTSRHFPGQHSSQYRREEIHICHPTVLWEAEQELAQRTEDDAQVGSGIRGWRRHEKTRSADLNSAKKIIQRLWSLIKHNHITAQHTSLSLWDIKLSKSTQRSFESGRQQALDITLATA